MGKREEQRNYSQQLWHYSVPNIMISHKTRNAIALPYLPETTQIRVFQFWPTKFPLLFLCLMHGGHSTQSTILKQAICVNVQESYDKVWIRAWPIPCYFKQADSQAYTVHALRKTKLVSEYPSHMIMHIGICWKEKKWWLCDWWLFCFHSITRGNNL